MAGLTGMKEICKYTERSESTVLMLIKNCAFPARKIGGRWESDTELIETWRRNWINGKAKKARKIEKMLQTRTGKHTKP